MTAADFYKEVDSLSKIKDFNSLHDELDSLYTKTNIVVRNILRKRTLREIESGNEDLMISEKIELLESCEIILNKKIQERKEFYSQEEKKKTFNQSLSMKRYRDFLLDKISELKGELTHDRLPVIPSLLKNNFDSTDANSVHGYFRRELVSKGFLDEETLCQFLELAFEKREYPNKLFKLKGEYKKKDVVKIFGTYYKRISTGNKYGKTKKYVELLSKYFDGFQQESLMSNFTKDV